MKHVNLALAALVALTIVGCGGDGPSSGGGDTTPTGPTLGPVTQIEAVLAIDRQAPADPNDYVYQDPLDLQTSSNVIFQLVTYKTDGTRVVLPATNWNSDDDDAFYGTLGATSGLFTSRDRVTTNPQTVSIRYNGVVYSARYMVKPQQATLLGKVVDEAGNPVRDVTLVFFNSSGEQTGTVRQPSSGYFYASLPLNTVSFQVLSSTVPTKKLDDSPTNFTKEFTFDGATYVAGGLESVKLPEPLTLGKNQLFHVNDDGSQGDELTIKLLTRS